MSGNSRNTNFEIKDYLQVKFAANIFYLYRESQLMDQLKLYIRYGTKSLKRTYKIKPREQNKKEISICVYKCYKVLTLIDCLKKVYPVVFTSYDVESNLVQYFTNYITSSCEPGCFKDTSEFSFFKHYKKRTLKNLKSVVPRFCYDDLCIKYDVNYQNEFPFRYSQNDYTMQLQSSFVSDLKLLDFDKCYYVVGLTKTYEYSTRKYEYIITLFNESPNHIMLNRFSISNDVAEKFLPDNNKPIKKGVTGYIKGVKKCFVRVTNDANTVYLDKHVNLEICE